MKKALILISILIIILLLFSGCEQLSFGRINVESTTKYYWRLDGQVTGCYDANKQKKYELISNPVGGTKYRTAFLLAKTNNGESEFITAYGQMWHATEFFDVITGRGVSSYGWYTIKHKSPGGDWQVIADETGNKVNWLNYNNPKKQKWFMDMQGFFQWGSYLKDPAIFSILGLSLKIEVTFSSESVVFPFKIAFVFCALRKSSKASIIPKNEVSAVFGIKENTVFLVSSLIASSTFGINKLPNFFLSV